MFFVAWRKLWNLEILPPNTTSYPSMFRFLGMFKFKKEIEKNITTVPKKKKKEYREAGVVARRKRTLPYS